MFALLTDPHPFLDPLYKLIGYLIVAAGGGGGALILKSILERKKIAAETHETDARAFEATARAELTLVKANVSASEMVRGATETIRNLQISSLELTAELDTAKIEAKRLNAEKGLLHNEIELLNLQMTRARTILDRHNLKAELSDLESIARPPAKQIGNGTG